MNIEFRKFVGQYDWGWVQTQVGIKQCEDTAGVMAIDSETNTTVGACIMDNWTPNSVQCHFMVANPLVLRHQFLECSFDFMFNTAGVKRVYGLVPANNDKAVAFNKHLGFTIKTVMEEAYEDGVDYLLMELKREDCLHLPAEEKAA